jgi:hypothetical protein
MWLTPRNGLSACSQESGDSTSPAPWRFQEAALSLTWKGKPTAAKFFSAAWRRTPWIQHLFGRMTSGDSRQSNGGTGLTPSLRGSLALRSARREPEEVSSMSGGSGRRSYAWSESRNPFGSSWRMCPAFVTRTLDGHSVPYSVIWPRSGSMRNGQVSRRPTWVPLTSGRDSSSSRGNEKLWPTPCVIDEQKYALTGRSQRSRSLSALARRGELPMMRRFRDGPPDPVTFANGSKSSRIDRISPRPRLNPRFVAWLMGFPSPAWGEARELTPSERMEMRSFLSQLRRRCESYTGG